jgi:proton glutamate symport protein
MQKLQSLHWILKLLAIIIFTALSYFGIRSPYPVFGFITLFVAMFILFEGFGMVLFPKILISLVLGILFASFQFFPAEDIISLKPIGSVIFMNCLTMTLVPLVFASILTGVTSLGDIKRLNRIGLKTMVYYIITTAIAISIGLGAANIIKPGKGISEISKQSLITQYEKNAQSKVTSAQKNKQSFFETIQTVFPRNIMESVSFGKPQMLQLIFFAIICGIALLQIDDKFSKPVIGFFYGISEMTIKIIMMIMRIAPYGIFALIAATIAQTGNLELILSLIPFSICVLLGLAIHMFVTNSISLKFLSKKNPIEVLKKIKTAAVTAFSTASSGATIPVTLDVTQNELGVKKEIAGFVIPLGATINMDGTALFQGVSTIFLANIYGIELLFIDQLIVIGLAVVASIGTAAVPGVGIVILTMILVSVGIPPEGILFILPVNNILDMCRTAVNVTGDITCSIFIDATEKAA